VEVAAASPTAAGGPRVPSPPGQTALPDLASRGSDSSPSSRSCPSPDSIDHLGTSDCPAQGAAPPGPRGRGRQPVRKRTGPARNPSARWCTAEPTVSFASQSSVLIIRLGCRYRDCRRHNLPANSVSALNVRAGALEPIAEILSVSARCVRRNSTSSSAYTSAMFSETRLP